MARYIDADALIADCQLAQKQADRDGREYANAFYSDGGEISTEWWCVEDMIENAPTIEPRKGKWGRVDDYDHEAPLFRELRMCPFCNFVTTKPYKFCPNCGADMRETE